MIVDDCKRFYGAYPVVIGNFMRRLSTCFMIIGLALQIVGQSKKQKTYQVKIFNGYSYEFAREYDPSFREDTLYTFTNLPFKLDRKIYHDIKAGSVATSAHFDTINQKIITKHYTKDGKLKKEQQICYTSREDYQPNLEDVAVKNVDFRKTYLGDSLICTITGFKTSLGYFTTIIKPERTSTNGFVTMVWKRLAML